MILHEKYIAPIKGFTFQQEIRKSVFQWLLSFDYMNEDQKKRAAVQ